MQSEKELYVHYRTKNRYVKICEEGIPQLEHPSTKEWESAVIYQEHSHLDPLTGAYTPVENPQVFVRSISSFSKSFSVWEP